MPRRKASISHSMADGKRSPKTKKALGQKDEVLDQIDEIIEEEEEEEGVSFADSIEQAGNLEDLIFLGRLESVVEVGNFTFVMTTLSGAQQKDIVKSLMILDEEERLMHVRDLTLAAALLSINDVPFDELCEEDDLISRSQALQSLQNNVLDALFEKYNEMTNEALSIHKDSSDKQLKK